MKKNFYELINHCYNLLGCSYLYGAKYEFVTQATIDKLAKQNPSMYTDSYIAKAKTKIGTNAVDCSGLISSCTGIVRGSTQYMQTSTTQYNIKTVRDIAGDFEDYIGWAVWKKGHIGVIVSKDYLIEAKGIDYGVVITKINPNDWETIIKLSDIDYDTNGFYNIQGLWRLRLRGNEYDCDGMVEYDGRTWYFENKILQQSRWLSFSNEWYYCLPDGGIATNQWINDDTKGWYFMGKDGKMVKDCWYDTSSDEIPNWNYFNISGKWLYKFDGSNKLILPEDIE